ncbi:DUF2163 domain-containing protein [Parvularcula sp. LCG005]|uniref:DUF2163 domain-containing protein n=1 Tax=Parvularcula sp. LCG005 TaxID=3078805 RepID=UPI002942873B|nr:DUF2163 domain-containing protein [Parvularcula sp. LCG005]WOI54000.1 DUF2163 domain-containing protein [Parvularcula sp. LCG005]
MLPVDAHTEQALSAAAASLCTCWRITRTDGVEIGVTDHDRDIEFTGTVFRSGDGADGTALASGADLAPDNADLMGILSSDVLGDDDIDQGRYDEARIDIWRVDWTDPEARLLVKSGTIGRIERSGAGYRAEFRSLKHYLDQVVGRVYGRQCDARLGDRRCGVDLTDGAYTAQAQIVSESARDLSINQDPDHPAGWFTGGTVEVLDGPLAGTRATIREHAVAGNIAILSLWDSLAAPVAATTLLRVTAGCDKRLSTCQSKFANAVNFRGFPHIPGSDILTRYPGPGGDREDRETA